VGSVFRTLNLPQGGPQVLGPAQPTHFSALRVQLKLLGFTCSAQAGAEHFQQCAEFPLLRNRGLGPLAVTVLAIPLARRGAATACAAV
jgi:hypothetical protein